MTKKYDYDVFVSYSRRDQGFVKKLVKRLLNSGLTIFYDETDLAIGASLADSLYQAVRHAKYVLVIMSPDYFASAWATKEFEVALSQEFEKDRTKVIPILYRDCQPPPLLSAKVYADFRTEADFEKSFPKLEAILRGQPQPTLPEPDEVEPAPAMGSMIESEFKPADLKAIIDDLREKVEAFIEKTEILPSYSPNASLQIDSQLCFIVMPFGSDELNDVYEYFVKPSIENSCSLRCERGDDVFGSNVIMEDIRQSIERARLVIADLTGRNPNVFYEVGIAHTLNKDVLLLSQSMNDVPFDLRHRRVLVYDYTPKGCKKLEKSIIESVNAILKGGA
jgi:hypothetical protein